MTPISPTCHSQPIPSALGITAVIAEDTAEGPRTVVLQINRYEFDDRLGRIQRRTVRGKLSGFVEDGRKERRDALGGER